MKGEEALKYIPRIKGYASRFRRCWFPGALPESVFFYTFHKCASTLFSSYILKNIKGLEHVDYASQISDNKRSSDKELTFRKKGYVYGPIRLSSNPGSPVHKLLTIPASNPDFIRDKISISFVRDPRDILVSAYYSFGFTHGLSQMEEIQRMQQARREAVQKLSLDEYVLQDVEKQVRFFQKIIELNRVCERGVILKYEDMINNFDSFINQLCENISLDDEVIREIHKRSRPVDLEDTESHRRSGRVGGFREKLIPATIQALNSRLEDILMQMGYPL